MAASGPSAAPANSVKKELPESAPPGVFITQAAAHSKQDESYFAQEKERVIAEQRKAEAKAQAESKFEKQKSMPSPAASPNASAAPPQQTNTTVAAKTTITATNSTSVAPSAPSSAAPAASSTAPPVKEVNVAAPAGAVKDHPTVNVAAGTVKDTPTVNVITGTVKDHPVRLVVGQFQSQGMRPQMEDETLVEAKVMLKTSTTGLLRIQSPIAFAGVFDGHGGKKSGHIYETASVSLCGGRVGKGLRARRGIKEWFSTYGHRFHSRRKAHKRQVRYYGVYCSIGIINWTILGCQCRGFTGCALPSGSRLCAQYRS